MAATENSSAPAGVAESLSQTETAPQSVSEVDSSPSGLVSDQFDGTLNTDVWTFIDPVGDGTLSMTGTQAAISVPAGSQHDIWNNANRAPRLRQTANNTDFQLEVKFDSLVNAGLQTQGIVVEQDEANRLRFDFYHNGSLTRVLSASFVDGQTTKQIETEIVDGVPLYLRVKRVGDQWSQSYSYNGADWIDAGTYTYPITVSSIGVYGGNGGANPAHTALIDYFVVDDSTSGSDADSEPNQEPQAAAGGPYSLEVGGTVSFDGSGSTDPDGDALSYSWDFGDGSQGTGVSPSHVYATAGTFAATLTVNDGTLTSPGSTAMVMVGELAAPELDSLDNSRVQQASLTVAGTAAPNQTVKLYNNGTLAATLSAAADGRFESAVQLLEGPNSLYARAASGAVESGPSDALAVYYDAGPGAVDPQQVSVADQGDGQVQVSAPPGTLEAGLTVVVNTRGGGSQVVTAAADGSFTATLAGSGSSEPVSINVQDGAGHRSATSDVATAVGALAGTFIVNETGAATYTIPIDIPPGVAGMQPELALNYNSQSGNGLLGMGWQLSGLSSITRCAKSYALDGAYAGVGFDDGDRFCLDGRRLIAVSGEYGVAGTVYRTEVDNFAVITQNDDSCGGPCGFTVETKSGQTLVYGNSDDARQTVPTTTAVLRWAMDRVTDVVGNAIEFEYRQDTPGDHRIENISYTHTVNTAPLRSVEFVYEPRPDVSRAYVAGTQITRTERLKTIRTRIDTQVVKEYRLNYGLSAATAVSRLESIAECVIGEDTAATCTPPTVFQWADRSVQWDTTPIPEGTGNFPVESSRWVGDFDGDGRQEHAALSASADVITISGIDNGQVNHQSWPVADQWGNASTWSGDFNGDGRTDLASGNGANVRMKLSTGTGFDSTTWEVDGNWGADKYSWAADFNGDGLTDIASAQGSTVYMKLSNRSGFDNKEWSLSDKSLGAESSTWIGDFNGDGLSDIASASGADIHLWFSTGSDFTSETRSVPGIAGNWGAAANTWARDVNGDGITDILTVATQLQEYEGYPDVPFAYVHVMASTGSDFMLSTYDMGMDFSATRFNYLEDINADGVMDLIIGYHDTSVGGSDVSKVRLGLRSGGFGEAFDWNGWSPANDPDRNSYVFADFNGDGRLDSSPNSPWLFALSESSHDVITAITSGLGNRVSVAYKSLSDDYSEGTCPGYPLVCTPFPLPLVDTHSVDDGIGGLAQFSYRFEEARSHARGRGFLGFNTTAVTDHQTGVETRTDFNNEEPGGQEIGGSYPSRYPYAGMAIRLFATQTYQPPPVPGRVKAASIELDKVYDSMEVTAFAVQETAAGSYFPYVQEKEEKQRETTGEVVSTTTTTTDYDDYGNATRIHVQTVAGTESFVKTTVNEYDPTRLRLGRLTRASVTSTTPDGSGTRTSGFSYRSDGLLESETIEPDEPDSSPLKQTTTYEYDAFGNPIKATVSALAGDGAESGVQHRIMQTLYDDYGLFPVRSINALGHEETYAYEPRYGARTLLIGPNGLATRWEYDDFGRLIRESRADGSETVTAYAWCGDTCPHGGTQVISETAGAPLSVVYKDSRDREIRRESDGLRPGSVIVQDTGYDPFGRVSRRSRPYYRDETPQWSHVFYDQLDRVEQEDAPDGGRLLYSYAPFTRTMTTHITGGDVAQIARTETYDALNRLRQVTEENGVVTAYGYDPFDNQVRVTVDTDKVTTIAYDIRGRKTAMVDPDMGEWSYRYNGFGELVYQKDSKGQEVRMVYDALGRMISRSEAEGTTTWTYDTAAGGVGQPARIEAPDDYLNTFAYDALGRPQTDTLELDGQMFALDHSYDRFGRIENTVYPSGFETKNVYDRAGYLTEVRNAASDALYWRADDADAGGQITMETLGNGLSTVRSFDPASGRLQTLTTGLGQSDSSVQHLTYVFDSLGNLQSRARSEGATRLDESFVYDNMNRLTAASSADVGSKTYAYDKLGNLKQKGSISDYRYADPDSGGGPHAATFANGQSYRYDANGNMLSGAGRTLTWSSYNKPVEIKTAQARVQFDYGPDRARYRQVKDMAGELTTTVYIGKLYEQISTQAQIEKKHYIVAGGQAVALYTEKDAGQSSTEYLHHDHLGSIDAVTDENGTVLERMSFSAFGQRRNATDLSDATGLIQSQFTTRGFTGHEQLDEIGLVHMNGRVYDPQLGRFLSADPQVQFPADSQSYNRYSYVLNNPLSFTDPSGFSVWGKIKDAFENVTGAVADIVSNQVTRMIATVVASYYTFGYVGLLTGNPVLGAAAAGFGAGLIGAGNLTDAVSGAALAAIGNYFALPPGLSGGGAWDNGGRYFGKIVSHGTVGGNSNSSGPAGAAGGSRNAATSAPVVGSAPSARIGRSAANMIISGMASSIGGSKFLNGAATDAFFRLYGQAREFMVEKGFNILGRTLTAIGGGGQVLLGGALCATTVAGCVLGAPLIVLGVSNIQEGVVDNDGFARNGFQAVLGDRAGDITFGVVNLGTSVFGLTRPVLRHIDKISGDIIKPFSLFGRRDTTDFVPAFQQATKFGLAVEGLTSGAGLLDTVDRSLQP